MIRLDVVFGEVMMGAVIPLRVLRVRCVFASVFFFTSSVAAATVRDGDVILANLV